MLLHASQGFRGQVIDLDTRRPVSKVISFDTEKNEVEAYQTDENGLVRNGIVSGEICQLTYRARGRFKFVPRGDTMAGIANDRLKECTTSVVGAPYCVKCGSPLTLPGKDLCAFCNAADKNVKGFSRLKPTSPLLVVPCDYPGCGQEAQYSVGDEVEASPELFDKQLYTRGATVGRRFYCAFHWKPARILDERGEVVKELYEEVVRP